MNTYPMVQKSFARRLSPTQITAIYLLVSVLWVLIADLLISAQLHDMATLAHFHPIKDGLFVLITAVLLYLLIQRSMAALAYSEQRLREQHTLLQAVIEGTTDAVFIKDVQGRYVLINTAGARIFGKTITKVIGSTDADLFSPDTVGQVRGQDRQILTRGEPQTFETHATLLSGGQRIYSTIKAPYRDEQGRIIGVIGIAREITTVKQAEERLKESEERFRNLVEKAKILPWVADGRTWQVTYVGPQAIALLGYPQQDWYQDNFWVEHLHPEDRDWVVGYCAQRAARQDDYAFEYRMLAADGGIVWLHDIVNVVRDANGPQQLRGYMIDITERKQLELTLERQAEQLLEADRRKDEFLAMLAHELRNPLTPIRAAVDVLKLQGPLETTVQWVQDIIDRQVTHLTRLVDDLLDVARITQGRISLRKQPVALAEIITRAVETVRPLIEAHRHRLTLSLPAEPVYLQADPNRLAQVVANLLDNAAKYTGDGGQIELMVQREDDEAIIRVHDTGIGISPELLPYVFDLFTQAKRSLDRSQGGLGLGLTLVKRLVELHGGRVQAESPGLGLGSEFVVRLPIEAPRPAEQSQAVHEPEVRGPARRILIVEDHQDVAYALVRLLSTLGHEVYTVSDGIAALEAARTFRPEVVLLDIGLPGMNGYEVATRLRDEHGQTLRLVALTGYGLEDDRRRMQEVGFDQHLLKPVTMNALQAVLTAISSS